MFECNEVITIPEPTERLAAYCENTLGGNTASKSYKDSANIKFRVYLVPQFIGTVKMDTSYARWCSKSSLDSDHLTVPNEKIAA